MRISGGKAKGITLKVPKGRKLRPVLEPARERLFSALGNLVEGASFLDLFAGTGSHGLEAVSRGATRGAFVELDGLTAKCLRSNLEATCKSAGLNPHDFEVLKGDALRATPKLTRSFDLIFADPPYPLLPSLAPKLFARIAEDGFAKEGALFVLGMPGDFQDFPPGWRLDRRLGKTGKGEPSHGLFRLQRD